MRQAGYLAAACRYALAHHVDRLPTDHVRAMRLASALKDLPFIDHVLPVMTNIVIAELRAGLRAPTVLQLLAQAGVRALPFGPSTLRFVTHLDVNDEAIERAIQAMADLRP
jgi:threonine aldolase